MDEREELTTGVACRVIKCRMRHFIFDKISEGESWRDTLLVFNDSVESEVLVEWARVLKLWTLPADQAIVEGLIKGALTTAEHHSQVLVEQDAKVPDLIAEYVKSFQPNTLLPEVS
jgi:hypothetical protein